VLGGEDLFALSMGGILIRTPVDEIQTYGRSAQGVTIMRLADGDGVVQALVLPAEEQVREALADETSTPPRSAS
jgi:DNA gyrase subunit A